MKFKTKLYFYLIPIILFLFCYGCKKDLTPADNTQPKIQLTLEDVGVTEAWLRLNIQNPNSKSQITITRDDSTIQQFNNLTTDTLIYDTDLLPNHDYTYTTTILEAEHVEVSSSVKITTMDTASHDFTWNIITIGDGNACLLRDICIINENDIWAVGEIHTNETDRFDSLGNWINPHNAVHWNGNEWELKRILFNYNGNPTWAPLYSIFAFNSDDIWFEAGIHWNGATFQTINLNISFPSHVNKIWGTSSEDLYIVGNQGLVAYFNGQTWKLIESGTDIDQIDVYGYKNSNSKINYQIFSGFEYSGIPDEGIILMKEENKINIIDNGIDGIISSDYSNDFASVWADSYYNFWVTSAGDIFKLVKTGKNNYERIMMLDGLRGIHRIRGNGANDIFVCGYYVKLRHFNGTSWFHFSELDDSQISLKSLDFKENIIAAVGGNRIYLGIRH